MGMDAMQTPRLANLGYVYIVKQLTNFANDERTDLTLGVMNNNAKGLTEQDRRDVAAFVNTLNNPSEHSDLKALKEDGTVIGQAYLGQIIVKYGIKDKVSACQSCHGYNGRGTDPIYPKIGQQKYVYLVNQLTRWRDASRANDLMGQMRAIAKNLTDDDIHNVATYLSQAPESTMGNSFVPNNQTTLNNILEKK
jgi:cytochrome c553